MTTELNKQNKINPVDTGNEPVDDCGCEGQSGCSCELGHAHAQPESQKPFVLRLAAAFILTLFFALVPLSGIFHVVASRRNPSV